VVTLGGGCRNIVLAFAILLTGTLGAQPVSYACADNAPFTFAELTALAKNPLPPPLEAKLNRVLAQPIVCNNPAIPSDGGGHPVRIVEWNIDHGLNESEIEAALRGPAAFHARVKAAPRGAARQRLNEELQLLSKADVIALDEVDYGVGRTQYRNVARDLASALGMNYAYGVEFIELERIYLGVDRASNVDTNRYRATEGSVVLSRYPIAGAEVVRLPMKYDWYGSEVKTISELEKARRWSAERLFDEHIDPQVRRGGRMALVVNLRVPESPTGLLTVVCPHLEDYTTAAGRTDQLAFLLSRIQGNPNPLVLAGDLNSAGEDAQPVSLRREIVSRVKSIRFWASEALFTLTPVTGLRFILFPINYFRNFHDPTTTSVPLALPNPESAQFAALKSFHFCDGGGFDSAGDPSLSYQKQGGPFSNSNQRTWKGFAPTYSMARTYHGVVGEYKIDWFLVKPAAPLFLPFDGRTLNEVNRAPLARISDHAPIVVSLGTEPHSQPAPSQPPLSHVSFNQGGHDGSPGRSPGPIAERCAAPPE
jgi:endonuclease/exonuclease/phosphatase family metal-dependent hydrolase